MRTFIIAAAVAEIVLLLAGGGYVLYRVRVRRGRVATEPTDGGPAPGRPSAHLDRLGDILDMFLPTPVARVAVLEPRLWWCLGAWALRRRPRNGAHFDYHRRSPLGPMVLLVLFTTPVEVLLLELLIPILWVRVVLLVAAVYALFWVVALYASMVVLPHRAHPDGLEVRYGAMADLWVPFSRVRSIRAERRSAPRGSLGIGRDGLSVSDGEAFFVMGGRTDVALDFDRPLPVRTLRGDRCVRRAYLAVDSPDELLAVLRKRVPGSIPPPTL